MVKNLDQLSVPGFQARTVPVGTIKAAGKKVPEVISQGDIFRPDKIAPGNLPQDQIEMIDRAKKEPEPEEEEPAPMTCPDGPKPAESVAAPVKSNLLPDWPTDITDCVYCHKPIKYLIFKDAAQTEKAPIPRAHRGACFEALRDQRTKKRAAKEARKRGK